MSESSAYPITADPLNAKINPHRAPPAVAAVASRGPVYPLLGEARHASGALSFRAPLL
ncbi:MAG: hypothetical protein M3R59_06230 [Verrucomicrobiota bacterium]|nr:hypothetical protein [Verrucomicrobiota bacterium]